jgi:hypothetical protein
MENDMRMANGQSATRVGYDPDKIAARFTGKYRELLEIVTSRGVIFLVVLAVVAIALIGRAPTPIAIFLALQVPTLIACCYVTSPNPNLLYRYPINWVFTIFMAIIYEMTRIKNHGLTSQNLGDMAALAIALISLYWLFTAIQWAWRTLPKRLNSSDRIDFLGAFAKLLATWGISLQVLGMVGVVVRQFLEANRFDSDLANFILGFFKFIDSISILQFVPVGVFVVALLLLVSLRLGTDHFSPIPISDILRVPSSPILEAFVAPFKVPIGILVNVVAFVVHFISVSFLALGEFADGFVARMAFILVGLFLAPLLLAFGHFLMFEAVGTVVVFMQSGHAPLQEVVADGASFLRANLLGILALCLYVLAAPPLAARYRNETIKEIGRAMKIELVALGRPVVDALVQSLSLYGILILAVVVSGVALGRGLDNYWIFYAAFLVVIVVVTVVNRLRDK